MQYLEKLASIMLEQEKVRYIAHFRVFVTSMFTLIVKKSRVIFY